MDMYNYNVNLYLYINAYISGFWFDSPIENLPDSQWDLHISVMLTAPFHLIKRCLPAMKTKGCN